MAVNFEEYRMVGDLVIKTIVVIIEIPGVLGILIQKKSQEFVSDASVCVELLNPKFRLKQQSYNMV